VTVQHQCDTRRDGDQVGHRDRQSVDPDRLTAPFDRRHLRGQRRAEHREDGETGTPHRGQRRQPEQAVVEGVERGRRPERDQPGDQYRGLPEARGQRRDDDLHRDGHRQQYGGDDPRRVLPRPAPHGVRRE